ncbi:hypothetical protein [Pedobacter nyackensis]|uniref:hypothetical protein n=1 Tax=Pedobacter nyackensis TaxID=475255 RepID=UPI00292EA8A4|nr:hypothetical protein [Pedobacter nyackensis]
MIFSLKISRLEDYDRPRQQVGLWNRLVWLDHGNEVVFVPAGMEFNNEVYIGSGWLLEFDTSFYHSFMTRYQEDYNNALFAEKASSMVFIPVPDKLNMELNDLAYLLKEAIQLSKSPLYLQSYTDLILLNVNRCYVQCEKGISL